MKRPFLKVRRESFLCPSVIPALAVWMIGLATFVPARTASAHGTIPPSLKELPRPDVPGLLTGRDRVIRSERYAIALGKALFWDIQVGSDGIACASCHHHAGADQRTANQVSPGHAESGRPTALSFETTGSGSAGGPNYALQANDFPLHRLADPSDMFSTVLFTTDDVIGSSGAFGGDFQASPEGSATDDCLRSPDPVFHSEGLGTRQVTSRNAPSVINATYSYRLFWDGRANNVFNGVNSSGARDGAAGVWTWQRRQLNVEPIALTNSALASQAVTPPVNTEEMSCAGRTLADVGRKLLQRRPLQFQTVHAEDSVLRRYRDRSGQGLKLTYEKLVHKAFHRRFWSAPESEAATGTFGQPASGGSPYSQAEANFALFFGLAIQAYEATLVSDDAPFDSERIGSGPPTALTAAQVRGLNTFVDFHCANCHSSATLGGGTRAAIDVDRRPIRTDTGAATLGLTDVGFINTGVVPGDHDSGVGGVDGLGIPLSLTAQYLDLLESNTPPTDPLSVRSCLMTAPFAVAAFGQPAFPPADLVADPAGDLGCSSSALAQVPSPSVVAQERALPAHGRLPDGTVGAFKVPSLRNVELTGPYMHNGGMATLEEVVELYDRGGNFQSQGKDAEFLFSLGLSAQTKADLVEFLRSLTDERVRWERAPFDHPSLPLPVGHATASGALVESTTPGFAGLAETQWIELPAVGASGRSVDIGPLKSFSEQLQP